MFSSASRVKLNRVALKDTAGITNLVPRRRRAPWPAESTERETVTTPEKAASASVCSSSHVPANSIFTEPAGPRSSVTAADRSKTEAEGDSSVCTPIAPIRRKEENVGIHEEGNCARGSHMRRSSTPTRCALCGDCKYLPPQKKSPGKKEQSTVKLKINDGHSDTAEAREFVIWISQYPKVTLCDIAPKCDVCDHNCAYTIPAVLKNNSVHCFKRETRAGFRFRPSCLGPNKKRREESSLVSNFKLCPRSHSEKSDCQRQRLTTSRRRLTEKISPNSTTCVLRGQTNKASTTCFASLLLGTNTWGCRDSICDKRNKANVGPQSDITGAEIYKKSGTVLGLCNENGSLPSVHDVEHIPYEEAVKSNSIDKRAFSGMCVDSHAHLEWTLGSSSTTRPTVKDSHVHMKPREQTSTSEPVGSDSPTKSSEGLCQMSEGDGDEPESFTCQRVRPYCRKTDNIQVSCARTSMPWPFCNTNRSLSVYANNNSPTLPNQTDLSSKQAIYRLPNSPTDPLSISTCQVGEPILDKRNGKSCDFMSSCSPHLRNLASQDGLHFDDATFSTPSQSGMVSGTGAGLASFTPVNGPEMYSSASTPSPSALGLCDWEVSRPVFPISSVLTRGGVSSLTNTPSSLPPSSVQINRDKSIELVEAQCTNASPVYTSAKHLNKAVGNPSFCEESQMSSHWSSPMSVPSCQSFLLLPQSYQESDGEDFSWGSPPKLEHCHIPNTSPLSHNIKNGHCTNEFLLPPLLSPITSPQRHLHTSSLVQREGCSKEKEELIETTKHKTLSGHDIAQTGEGDRQSSRQYFDQHRGEGPENRVDEDLFKSFSLSSQSSATDSGDDDHDENHNKINKEQGRRNSEQVLSTPKINAKLLSEPSFSSSCDEGSAPSDGDERSCLSEVLFREGDKTEEDAAGDSEPGILDEFSAYEQDVLLVDVIQEDPELFKNLPDQSLRKVGPTNFSRAPQRSSPRTHKTSTELEQRLTPVIVKMYCNSPDTTEEDNDRPWRPRCTSRTPAVQSQTEPTSEKQIRNKRLPDINNNPLDNCVERSQPLPTVTTQCSTLPLLSLRNGAWPTNPTNMADSRHPKTNTRQYCRRYFSESLSCGFKMCRFQHVPVEGDEKFCIEIVMQFIKNPTCLQKAGVVFSGYYQNNSPGLHFSMPVYLSLLWSLLKARMLSDVLSVLSVSLTHKIAPGHEFLLALFKFVRDNGLVGFVPELTKLTFKMASEGLVLSQDWLKCVKNAPEFEQMIHANFSENQLLSVSPPYPEYLKLAQSTIEVELCSRQEDWRGMGKVFRSICQSSHHPHKVERFSGLIAIALLSESKDKLSLPFATFVESVCREGEDTLIQSFLGRIGVSLMLRYHKTHQWAKGRRVVEVLSLSKIHYSTLKGLFGNEDRASRCSVVTVAADLFLLTGSVEGALNSLRDNDWFQSSHLWPCDPVDLDSRNHLLMRLAEETSHRDTLEVLSNLPGIKEPHDLIDISRYSVLFNRHLQLCVDRHMLPVASDTVDFMFCKNLAVDNNTLQRLLHKLGKQNLWLRAREVFRHSLNVGYYPGVSAPSGFMALIVPSHLGEVELALAFEMFIAVNATIIFQLSETSTSCLSITLKRAQSSESEYLLAGSSLFSAASIPQPKLTIHFVAVNAAQEQVFTVDISSARRWLHHNHSWANEVWTHKVL